MTIHREDNSLLFVVAFVVLLTRIPFLFSGYGSEEDAWGLILTARNINFSGIYEVSRLPGHPVQEYLLSFIWRLPDWTLNLLTAIVSSAGVLFYMLTLKKIKLPGLTPIYAGIALAFTPVFYIHSTNVMDYTWALSLVLLAFYLTVNNNYFLAGIILGIACGFRITAGAMVIPFVVWHYMNHRSFKAIMILGIMTGLTALVCFIPVWNTYGIEFFTYYEYFPYPPFLKNVYKATVGAWGMIGIISIIITTLILTVSWRRRSWRAEAIGGRNLHQWKEPFDDDNGENTQSTSKAIIWMCIIAIVLYTYSFLKIPQKTAFVLPMVPFIILLFAVLLKTYEMLVFTLSMIFSCFFLGVNLDDPIRGSKPSLLAINTTFGSTPISIDLLSGPVIADFSKRELKINYAKSVVSKLSSTKEKTVIIAGWWQNELNYFSIDEPNPLVTYVYYIDEKELQNYKESGCQIYFLPEQNFYNDLRFKNGFTDAMANPF